MQEVQFWLNTPVSHPTSPSHPRSVGASLWMAFVSAATAVRCVLAAGRGIPSRHPCLFGFSRTALSLSPMCWVFERRAPLMLPVLLFLHWSWSFLVWDNLLNVILTLPHHLAVRVFVCIILPGQAMKTPCHSFALWCLLTQKTSAQCLALYPYSQLQRLIYHSSSYRGLENLIAVIWRPIIGFRRWNVAIDMQDKNVVGLSCTSSR